MTGAGGFIGSHLIRRLKAEEVEILAIIRSKGSHTPDHDDITFLTVDILDYTTLHQEIRRFQPDIVFHLVSQNST
nr:NAD-dependent epimerase/dehydratase family protein [Desulforamulus putei]